MTPTWERMLWVWARIMQVLSSRLYWLTMTLSCPSNSSLLVDLQRWSTLLSAQILSSWWGSLLQSPQAPAMRHSRILTWNLQPISKWDRKAATIGFPMASSTPYVVEFGPIRYPTDASEVLGVGFSYNTAENIRNYLKWSDIIPRTTDHTRPYQFLDHLTVIIWCSAG